MLKLYKNKKQTFECKIEIDGASYTKANPRLIFYPDNDSRNLMFEGTLKHDTCTIVMTPNVNINNHGKVVLEVVVDDATLFTPWDSTYEIVTEQARIEKESISLIMEPSTPVMKLVEDIKILDDKNRVIEPIKAKKEDELKQDKINHIIEEQSNEDNAISYMMENWSKDSKELVKEVQSKHKITANKAWKIYREVKSEMDKVTTKKKIQDEVQQEEKQLFTENCASKDKEVVNEYLVAIRNLEPKERKSFLKFVNEDYVPKDEAIKWAKPIFNNLNALTARISMYCYEVKMND